MLLRYPIILLLLISLAASAQKTSTYDPHTLFAPNFYTSQPSTRTADGSPNFNYWQNKADYQINVLLNDKTNTIAGSVVITYKNNSPQALSYLWLYLEQNLFAKDSRGQQRMPVGTKSRYGDASSLFEIGRASCRERVLNLV